MWGKVRARGERHAYIARIGPVQRLISPGGNLNRAGGWTRTWRTQTRTRAWGPGGTRAPKFHSAQSPSGVAAMPTSGKATWGKVRARAARHARVGRIGPFEAPNPSRPARQSHWWTPANLEDMDQGASKSTGARQSSRKNPGKAGETPGKLRKTPLESPRQARQ